MANGEGSPPRYRQNRLPGEKWGEYKQPKPGGGGAQPGQPQPQGGGGAFEWGAADSARREQMAQGHYRIREKIRNTLPALRGPNWEYGQGGGGAGGPGGGGGGGGGAGPREPTGGKGPGGGPRQGPVRPIPGTGGPEPEGEPQEAQATGQAKGRLGRMFGHPEVRAQVLKISNDWELSNQIRKGGIHAAVRHAFGLPLIPSHKEDYLYARQRNLDPNPLTGRNPGHYQPEDWPMEI